MSYYLLITVLIILLLLLLLLSQLKFEKRKLILEGKNGKRIELQVEIADNSFKHALGLMFRNKLGDNEGMLFIFPDEKQHAFWMLNTKIPLDTIFFDSDKKVVEIIQMEPCVGLSCPSYPSKKAAKYVLEVNKDFTNRNNITNNMIFKLF